VRPRYTAGSPARVDMDTALQVAAEELWSFENMVQTGVMGETWQQIGEAVGLADVVVANWQRGARWFTLDLLTRELIESKIRNGSIVRDRLDPIRVIEA
jgi:hypothetical protein